MVLVGKNCIADHEAILEEIVGPGLIAVNTCVDMMCVSIIRATTGPLPIVGHGSQHGRQRYAQNDAPRLQVFAAFFFLESESVKMCSK